MAEADARHERARGCQLVGSTYIPAHKWRSEDPAVRTGDRRVGISQWQRHAQRTRCGQYPEAGAAVEPASSCARATLAARFCLTRLTSEPDRTKASSAPYPPAADGRRHSLRESVRPIP